MHPAVRRAVVLAVVVALPLAWAACGSSSDGTGGGSSTSPLPSGSLGVVRPAAAATALEGLCTLAAGTTDRAGANAVFYDEVHEELHVIAAAVQPRDVGSAADLLTAKERVESDLQGSSLPEGFGSHVSTLLAATQQALRVLGLSVPTCG